MGAVVVMIQGTEKIKLDDQQEIALRKGSKA